jgi:hypothetical protein
MKKRRSHKSKQQHKGQQRVVVHRTAWHPIMAEVLSLILPPWRGYEVLSEYQLSFQPLRCDYVVVRKDRLATPESAVLSPLTRLLGDYTGIELTGPTSVLTGEDFCYAKLYASLLFVRLLGQRKVKALGSVRSIQVASRLTESYREMVKQHQGTLEGVEPGVYEITGQEYKMYCIETEVAGDHLLRLLSPLYLKDPSGLFALLSEEEKAIFYLIADRIEQFKQDPRVEQKYPDWKEIAMTTQEFMEKMLSRMSPEQRLKGLSWEARLQGLPAEARLQGLPAEARLQGLSLEDRLTDLSPEQREALKKLLK